GARRWGAGRGAGSCRVGGGGGAVGGSRREPRVGGSAGGRGRGWRLQSGVRGATSGSSRPNAGCQRLLWRALRDGDRRDQGAGGTPVRQVRTALDVPRPSDGSVSARRVLAVLAVAELLAMAPWFSASAVAPTLSRAWQLTPADTA